MKQKIKIKVIDLWYVSLYLTPDVAFMGLKKKSSLDQKSSELGQNTHKIEDYRHFTCAW